MEFQIKEADRFWERVVLNQETGCWEWSAGRDEDGYGLFYVRRLKRNLRAHRWVFECYFFAPGSKFVCHHCDNPSCVNPGHLFLGDAQSNKSDCVKKRRHARGELQGRSKLTDTSVREIRRATIKGESTADIARRLNISYSVVRRTAVGKKWMHVPGALASEKKYLSPDDVTSIRIAASKGITYSELGARFGISASAARSAATGVSWKNTGCLVPPTAGRRLSPESVIAIRRLRKTGATLSIIARRFGTSMSTVSLICLNRIWKPEDLQEAA